jgi:hypothetical protein
MDRAEFYKSDKEWRCGGIPLKVLSLEQSRASEKHGPVLNQERYSYFLHDFPDFILHLFAWSYS